MTLAPGELLVFFTDGLLEARAADGKTMFRPATSRRPCPWHDPDQPLAECAEQAAPLSTPSPLRVSCRTMSRCFSCGVKLRD